MVCEMVAYNEFSFIVETGTSLYYVPDGCGEDVIDG